MKPSVTPNKVCLRNGHERCVSSLDPAVGCARDGPKSVWAPVRMSWGLLILFFVYTREGWEMLSPNVRPSVCD